MSRRQIQILHVDDEPDFADLTKTFLEREDDSFTVETVTRADEGLKKIKDNSFACVISDYNMPDMNGLKFLQTVRENHPDLPFILFTGKGSEAVASDAISAGVTDYLQKGSGTEQYELLANRIQNAVRVRREAERADRQEQLMRLTEFAGDTGGFELDYESGDVTMTDGARRILHLPEQANRNFEKNIENYHPDDRDKIRQTIQRAAQTGEQTHGTYRYQHPDTEKQQLLDITYTPIAIDGDKTVIRGALHDITERSERQRELQWLQQAIDDANIPITLADPSQPDEPLVYVNDAFEKMTGYPAEEAVGRNCRFLQGEDTDPEKVATLREAISSEESISVELCNYRKDGTRFWNRLTLTPVYDGDGDLVRYLGNQQDTTERRKRKTELEKYETIIETLSDAVYVLDEEGRFTYVNDKFVELVGYDRETILGNTSSLIKDAETVERAEDQLGRLLSNEGPDTLTFEVTIQPRDGDPIVCEDRMSVLPYDGTDFDGSVGTLRELTERNRREQKLELIETLFANAQECQFIVDATDDTFELRHANDYYKRTVGLSPGEPVTGQTPTELFGNTGGQAVRDRYRKCVETRESVTYTLELPVPEKGTVYRTILSPVVSDADVTHIVGTARDISERERRENQLRRQKERLEEFNSVISHDLRHPLRVANGRLELIREECESQHIDDVAQALGRMDTLIEDLLTLARGGEQLGDTEPVVLADLANDCWQIISAPDAEVVPTIDRTVRADRSRLKQLVENLFQNAIKHSDGSTTVTVGEMESGFYIEDDGPGIPEENRDDVFEAGYTTSSDGTGFGLRIVKQVANAHGWDVVVVEGEQGGARFEISGVEFANR